MEEHVGSRLRGGLRKKDYMRSVKVSKVWRQTAISFSLDFFCEYTDSNTFLLFRWNWVHLFQKKTVL